jgi:serine/threonine protein kinase
MSLTPGTRLGPFEIDAAIGAGGMGEVYRALYKRLIRPVAIKLLIEESSASATRRFRARGDAASALITSTPALSPY